MVYFLYGPDHAHFTKENNLEHHPFKGQDLAELAQSMLDIRAQHMEEKAQAAATWALHELLSKKLIPEMMEELGMTSVNITGVGRLEVRHEASCSIPKENKYDVYQWVEDNGYGDLIVGTINSSTFKAQVKKWIKDGEDFPMELINFTPYDNAVLIKVK